MLKPHTQSLKITYTDKKRKTKQKTVICKTNSSSFQVKLTIQLKAPLCFRVLALQAYQWMSDSITAHNSLHVHWSYKRPSMSGGKVNITAVLPANKPVSNWWQCCGTIHTHNSKISDKIRRMCLSTPCFQATKQTFIQSHYKESGMIHPASTLSIFYTDEIQLYYPLIGNDGLMVIL